MSADSPYLPAYLETVQRVRDLGSLPAPTREPFGKREENAVPAEAEEPCGKRLKPIVREHQGWGPFDEDGFRLESRA